MNTYPNPFIPERADPYIVKAADGFYYFTASYPAFMSAENGYDRIILRKSETVSGLKMPKSILYGLLTKAVLCPVTYGHQKCILLTGYGTSSLPRAKKRMCGKSVPSC